MAVRVSATSFFTYLVAQATTRVAKVRQAKKMMEAAQDDYRRMDYWLFFRNYSIEFLKGSISGAQLRSEVGSVADSKKLANYQAASEGLVKWKGRRSFTVKDAPSIPWTVNGLSVSVTPEVIITSNGTSHVVKLYFSAEPLSKYLAGPMLRLLETTHGHLGTAGVLDVRRAKLHSGPTSRPADLDLLLKTEAASFVRIWNSL